MSSSLFSRKPSENSSLNPSGSIERESISLTIITGTIGRLYQDVTHIIWVISYESCHMTHMKIMRGQSSTESSKNPLLIKRQSSLTAKISNGFTLKITRCWWHMLETKLERVQMLLATVILVTSWCWWPKWTKPDKKLSPTHFVSNIHHQQPCNRCWWQIWLILSPTSF